MHCHMQGLSRWPYIYVLSGSGDAVLPDGDCDWRGFGIALVCDVDCAGALFRGCVGVDIEAEIGGCHIHDMYPSIIG